MSVIEKAQHLRISLQDIESATNNFSSKFIGSGGYGNVYACKLPITGDQIVAVKRLDPASHQGESEFVNEIQMLSLCRDENIIRLIGFCDESVEKILVYEHANNGSLDTYLSSIELSSVQLSWKQRLEISIGVARGLCYLHNNVGLQHRVLHSDIKSSNILLNENYEAKVSDFGLSKIGLSNVEFTFVATEACGTRFYVDPQYAKTNILTKESDVYSFGVVLFEILCGRLAHEPHLDGNLCLPSLAIKYFDEDRLVEIIHPNVKTQKEKDSVDTFAKVAYECLNEHRSRRPTMALILQELEKALKLQVGSKVPKFIRVGPWGGQRGEPKNDWSFKIEQDHHLSNIKIDHGDVIYSLKFTSKSSAGAVQNYVKAGGGAREDTGCEINFEDGEEIISIDGTIGGIGVYMKACEEIIRVGTWGTTKPASLRTDWSFQLHKNHYLKRIDINHGEQIISLLMFSDTEYGGSLQASRLAGGWNGGVTHEQINLEWKEEILGIEGTVGDAKGDEQNLKVITSLSFLTSKRKTFGPYGVKRGTHFEVQWDAGSFVGFYGHGGYFIDSIGVYLKATTSKIL